MTRLTKFAIGAAAALVLAAAVISASRAIAPRAPGLTYSRDDSSGRADIPAAVVAETQRANEHHNVTTA